MLISMAGAAALAMMLSGPVAAGEPTVTKNGDQSFEIHDSADSPPVNYRSREDSRYDTARQHDAEMYAEQYEKKRIDQQLRDRRLMDKMNTFKGVADPVNGAFGARDAGFPSRAPY
jgi:hypothetical protein